MKKKSKKKAKSIKKEYVKLDNSVTKKNLEQRFKQRIEPFEI